MHMMYDEKETARIALIGWDWPINAKGAYKKL